MPLQPVSFNENLKNFSKEFYELVKKNDATLTEEHLLDVAKRTMLPLDELKMHVDHLRLTAE